METDDRLCLRSPSVPQLSSVKALKLALGTHGDYLAAAYAHGNNPACPLGDSSDQQWQRPHSDPLNCDGACSTSDESAA